MASYVLAFGYHNQRAPRHWNICRDYAEQGMEVIECHTEKSGLIGKFVDLTKQYRAKRDQIDEVLVTFPGQYLMPLAWALTRWPRKTLKFDAFISLKDSLVDDRGKVSKWSPYAWFLYFVDWMSCQLADEVWIDTKAHKEFFVRTFGIKPEKVKVVYVRSQTEVFYPREKKRNDDNYEVFFYGTYIPLQGTEFIVEAARILKDSHPQVHFTMVGSGQTYKETKQLAEDLNNITFIDRLPFEELPEAICQADLCLGIFGTTDKAARVIPHKVFDYLACDQLTLTQDSLAIRELYANDPRVILCIAGSGQAIADKIANQIAD